MNRAPRNAKYLVEAVKRAGRVSIRAAAAAPIGRERSLHPTRLHECRPGIRRGDVVAAHTPKHRTPRQPLGHARRSRLYQP
jgi:hypothetical protein